MCDLLFFMFILINKLKKMCLVCVEMDIKGKKTIGGIIYIQNQMI